MKLPLPGSVRGLVTLMVALALLPALLIFLFTSYNKALDDVEQLNKTALRAASGIARHQSELVENTHLLLLTLSQLDEIRRLDGEESAVIFRNLLLHAPFYANIRLCGLDGTVLASADFTPAPLSEAEGRLFAAARKDAHFSVQALAGEQGRADSVLLCGLPVRVGGEIRALLLASLTVGLSAQQGERLAANHVERVYLVDEGGMILFSYPARELEGTPVAGGLAEAWARMGQAGERYGVVETTAGQHMVFGRLLSGDGGGAGISVVLNVSPATIYDRTREHIVNSLFLLLGILAVGLAVTGRLCSYSLHGPMRLLLKAATRIKEGDLATRIGAIAMPTELRLLADSMDSMAESLFIRDRELTEARDAADAANKAKTNFLATMSHEIRTPMNAILGMTYLSRQGDLSEQQRGYLDKIHGEGGRLLETINDILDFSKMEAGKLHLEQTPFSLRAVLDEALAAPGQEARDKGVDFSASLAPGVPPVLIGDPTHVTQVLANLAGNAVKVTQRGMVSVSCGMEQPDPPALTLVLRITDTAGGLNGREMEQYFPQREREGAMSVLEDGIGLNLAVTRKLIQLMLGSVDVTTEAGRGSTVTLRLPLVEGSRTALEAAERGAAPAFEAAPAAPTGAPAATPPEAPATAEAALSGACDAPVDATCLGGLHILLVDDNLVNLMVAEEILQSAGARVRSVSDGREAVKALADLGEGDAPYQVVLMDLQMPGMDGFAATRAIRAMERFAHLPVIAMTAQDKNEEWEACRAAGMSGFIGKPIDVPVLLRTIANITGNDSG